MLAKKQKAVKNNLWKFEAKRRSCKNCSSFLESNGGLKNVKVQLDDIKYVAGR